MILHREFSRWSAALLFEPHDLWIGAYWKRYVEMGNRVLVLYLCLIPMLPIRLAIISNKWRIEP